MRQTASALLIVVCTILFGSPTAADDRDTRAHARTAHPPLGLPPVTVPENDSLTSEKIALGRKLFFDRRLSHNGTISCGMCHVPEQGFAVNEMATAIGIGGRTVRRNAPTVLNSAYQRTMFHDGRDTSLETQVLGPLVAANEMGNPSLGYVVAVVASLPDYAGLFEKAFDEPASVTTIGRAIAAWERTLLAGDSPFDRWHFGGDTAAVDAAAKRGFALFEGKAGCTACHIVEDDHALFTDHGFHATGIGYRNAFAPSPDDSVRIQLAPGSFTTVKRRDLGSISEPVAPDGGRYEVTLDPQDRWKYKTPDLRNVALTAPYMHDGSLLTLRDVVDFYNRGGVSHPGLDPAIQPLSLSDSEVDDIVAFLESLTAGNIFDLIADARSVKVGNVGD